MESPESSNGLRELADAYGYNIKLEDFFRCALSVDCVIFGYDRGEMKVLLIQRGAEPYKGEWALPGDLMYPYEHLNDAAHRVLRQLTGIKDIFMEQAQSFGSVGRHPVGRVVTVSYYALVNIADYVPKADSWAKHLKWHPVSKTPALAFDHDAILSSMLDLLRANLRSRAIGFHLLPEKFTLKDIQSLYESILLTSFDKANFRKKILASNLLVPLEEVESNVNHRPAKLYRLHDRSLKDRVLEFS